MTDHVCEADATASGTMVVADGREEFKMGSQEYGTFTCSCGAEFDTIGEARDHVRG